MSKLALCPILFSNIQQTQLHTFSQEWHKIRQVVGRLPYCIVYRTLLSESLTRIEQYKRQRIFLMDQIQHNNKSKNQLFVNLCNIDSCKEARHNVFEVITATHCAQNKEECETIENVLMILMQSLESKAKNNITVGASVFRMYHYLEMPDEAYSTYKNEEFGHLFKDNTCHMLLMDLLYKHGQFSRAEEVFFGMEKFNIDCVTLVFGCLYHINTPESFTKSQSLLVIVTSKYHISRRAVLFAAKHALNQGHPDRAIETLKFVDATTIGTNIELMSRCQLNDIQEVLFLLNQMQNKTNDISQLWNLRIYCDTWQEIISVMECGCTEEERKEFELMKIGLEQKGVLSVQPTKKFLERTLFGDFDYKKGRAKRILHRTASKKPS